MQQDHFSGDPQERIAAARSDALDRVLTGLAVVGLLGAPASASRSIVTGWEPMYTMHLIIGAIVVGLWMLRRRLSMPLRFWSLILFMWLIGLTGVISLGMLGAGTWWLASSTLFAGMIMSLRTGIILAGAALVAMSLVALAFTSGMLTVSIDTTVYMSSYSTWITYILVAAWMPIVIFGAFVKQSEVVIELAKETARAQESLREFANIDTLTGAFRPHILESRLSLVLSDEGARDELIGVIFIDLDKFKPINDTYGHAAGDAVLKAVVDRSREVLRSGDMISRAGGDEFVVVIGGVSSEAEAEAVARKLRKSITRPFRFEGQRIEIALSMGLAVGVIEGVSGEQLLKTADQLMYEAKRSGEQVCVRKLPRLQAA